MKKYAIFLILLLLSVPVFIEVYGQQRDLLAEYCTKNWIRDLDKCADYIPKDYNERKAEYQTQESKNTIQDSLQPKSESPRVCPVGSHLSVDNFGNQICVDSKTNQVVTNPDTGQSDFGSNGIIIGIVVLIVIVIIAGIAKSSKTQSGEHGVLARRSFSQDVRDTVLQNQEGRCAICGRHASSFQFDHKDGNHSNNSPSNCQALCPNCHDRKSRGLD